ncbi:hypothetical protein ACG04Q_00880 [Roseateles sp. DXS20W]|uniref:Uncharacterized protein n=1 Tax=Pelomonas lactea TaxID=3299030 RepID=A0ABW7GDR6_9BURK
MPSQRKRRSTIAKQRITQRSKPFDQELLSWDEMRPVGREFGSPDFERLMAEDARAGVGVFDPALKLLFPKTRRAGVLATGDNDTKSPPRQDRQKNTHGD